jgi:high-affinity K+ transport system ATPase subunit B
LNEKRISTILHCLKAMVCNEVYRSCGLATHSVDIMVIRSATDEAKARAERLRRERLSWADRVVTKKGKEKKKECHALEDQHRIAVAVEAVFLLDRDLVCPAHRLHAGESGDEQQQTGARQVEIRHQGIDDAEVEWGADG